MKPRNLLLKTFLPLFFVFTACNMVKTEPIEYGKEQCHNCKMTLIDPRFGVEAITDKGKVYKFDAVECMLDFTKQKPDLKWNYFVTSHLTKNQFISANQASFIIDPNIKSPMGLGILASENQNDFSGQKVLKWQELVETLQKQNTSH